MAILELVFCMWTHDWNQDLKESQKSSSSTDATQPLPFYRWENQGLEIESKLPKVTKLQEDLKLESALYYLKPLNWIIIIRSV